MRLKYCNCISAGVTEGSKIFRVLCRLRTKTVRKDQRLAKQLQRAESLPLSLDLGSILELVLLWVVAWCCLPALLDAVGPFVDGGGPPAIRWSSALRAIALEERGERVFDSRPVSLTFFSLLLHERRPVLGYTRPQYRRPRKVSGETVLPVSAVCRPT